MNYGRRKKIISIIALIIVIIFVLGMIISPLVSTKAASLADLQKKQQQLASQQKQIEQKIKANEQQQKSADQQITDKQSKITNLQSQIDINSAILNAYTVQIAQKEDDIKKAQNRIDTNYSLFKDRIRAMYKAGEVSYLDVLLSSESVTDFLYRYEAVNAVAAHDTDLIDQLKADKQQVEQAKASIEKDQASVQTVQGQLTAQQADLKNQKSQLQALKSSLQDQHQDYEEADAALDKQIDQQNKAIQKAIQESQSTGAYMGSGFVWPIWGLHTYISSAFGIARAGHSVLHEGEDIAAGGINGQPIHVADNGVVKIVNHYNGDKYSQPYGNYVVVDHGGGVSTMYAHMSSIATSVGATVTKGQVIGYVGSTGNSTGPHLHFGVLKNGVFVNPEGYSYSNRS